ncbi:Auxin-responsive protein [Abeliophyllum distichum]|uniref:Auxin-responsive protein n=1 Tax=Abeliophyllum distichum TaxID=126358 RepID=A0ABD1V9F5_9LAMI
MIFALLAIDEAFLAENGFNELLMVEINAADSNSSKQMQGQIKGCVHKARDEILAQIVGWPSVRSYQKNNLQPKKAESKIRMYVKCSESIFELSIGEYSERKVYRGLEYAPAYEDKDGGLRLVGDVPWMESWWLYVAVKNESFGKNNLRRRKQITQGKKKRNRVAMIYKEAEEKRAMVEVRRGLQSTVQPAMLLRRDAMFLQL